MTFGVFRRRPPAVLRLAAALAVLCGAPACGGTARPAPGSAGATLIVTARSEPRSFNRLAARDVTSDLVSQLTQAKLVRIDHRTGTVEPWLAERWTRSDDGSSYRLELRRGVRFSDGAPFSSADVLFSFRAVYDERVASALAHSLLVGGKPLQVTAPDAHSVVVTLPSPFGPGVRLLDNLPILPRHRLESALDDGSFRKAWGVTTPPSEVAGLGPFVLAEYAPGQRLVFSRNPHYWRKGTGGAALPHLDRLVVEIVPDQNAEVLRLDGGQTDLMQSEVRPEDYAALKRAADAGRLKLTDVGVGLDPSFMWFNLRPNAFSNDPRRAWLQSRELRHAISHAVDRESFANTVFLGAGVPVHGPVTPGNRTWFSEAAPIYPYDPERSRALLASLGLKDLDGDGLLEDRQRRPARFSLLTNAGNTSRERGAAVLQEDLRKVGLSVDVVALEPGALADRLTKGEYEAAYFGTLASDTDPAVNLDFWLSSGAFHVWHPEQQTPATEWERRIDELMQRQVASSDQAERKRLFDEVQRIFGTELPALYFVAPRIYVASSSRLENVYPILLRPQVLWNADSLAVARRRESTH